MIPAAPPMRPEDAALYVGEDAAGRVAAALFGRSVYAAHSRTLRSSVSHPELAPLASADSPTEPTTRKARFALRPSQAASVVGVEIVYAPAGEGKGAAKVFEVSTRFGVAMPTARITATLSEAITSAPIVIERGSAGALAYTSAGLFRRDGLRVWAAALAQRVDVSAERGEDDHWLEVEWSAARVLSIRIFEVGVQP